MRKAAIFPVIVGAAVGLLAATGAADAWDRWAYRPYAWRVPRWAPAPYPLDPAALPVPGYRLFYPPGLPLSYQDPPSGTTYCFSPSTGFYYLCGYDRPAWQAAVSAFPPGPGGPPPADPDLPPQPSGVLLFRLPHDAEAAVDGEPVGLTGGLGAAAVSPGAHRVLIRTAGQATERTITVASRAILTVTPAGITPSNP
ncbi:MAG TPA: hypothetical protein VIG69_14155 [Candidatus Methylomirabilis sp.]